VAGKPSAADWALQRLEQAASVATMPFLDTSILLASLDPDEPQHVACDRLLSAGGHQAYTHALAEVFSVLTGGRLGRRVAPGVAASLVQQSILPYVQLLSLTEKDHIAALLASEARDVCGGAIYDWLHLCAARKARAEVFMTLNLLDFQALARPGDPAIQAP